MSGLRTVAVVAFWLACAAGAQAADVALILGDRGQSAFFGGFSGGGSSGIADTLDKAGFDVIEASDRDAKSMREAARRLETRLDEGAVGRLLVLVTGPFAENGRDSWALSNDAVGVSRVTVGAVGISINALSDLAARANRGVVMIAPGTAPRALGPGLRPGPGEIMPVGRVTYFKGDVGQLRDLLETQLLDPDQTYADVARSLPSEVKMAGFTSAREGFTGAPQTADPEMTEEAGYWRAMREIDLIDGYRRYLNAYPKGRHGQEARARIAYLREAPGREAKAAEAALNLTRAARREVQQSLKLLGFDPRGIDGLFGSGSRAAISAWQRANGFVETGYLTGNQLFRLKDMAAAKRAEIEAEEDRARKERERRDRAYWRDTGRDGGADGLRAYLDRYPEGTFAELAQERLEKIEADQREAREAEERAAWEEAREGGTPDDYRAFLEAYPDGLFAGDARKQLDIMVTPGPTQAEIAQARAEERRAAGNTVARLLVEQRLRSLGYNPGTIDGTFSARSREAIRQYQTDRGLAATGYVSDATVQRLLQGQ